MQSVRYKWKWAPAKQRNEATEICICDLPKHKSIHSFTYLALASRSFVYNKVWWISIWYKKLKVLSLTCCICWLYVMIIITNHHIVKWQNLNKSLHFSQQNNNYIIRLEFIVQTVAISTKATNHHSKRTYFVECQKMNKKN